jgi:hypothetical protein
LTNGEQAPLAEAVARSQPALRPLVDELVAGERRLRADGGDALRDAVTDELARIGFDAKWEPNDRGRALEELIDKLARVTALSRLCRNARAATALRSREGSSGLFRMCGGRRSGRMIGRSNSCR